MLSRASIVGGLVLGLACSGGGSSAGGEGGPGGGSSAGLTGAYSAVNGDPIALEFKAGGIFSMAASGLGASSGTYTVDGEKLIVSVDGQTHTFIRDGNCIEEPRHIFGKLCKGGKSGETSNVSTRNVPTTPAGIYVATNADGEFRLEFRPGNRLALTMTPPGGNPDTQEGTYTFEGDAIYATLAQATPMVLKFVNNTYESTAFGLPMRFIRQ